MIEPRYETVTTTGVRRLYHYKRVVPAHLEALLQEGTIYFSNPTEFNDPWDCKPWFKIPDDAAGRAQLVGWLDQANRRQGFPVDERLREQQMRCLIDCPALLQEKVEQLSRRIGTALGDVYRVYCLSTKPDCALMWAHYGDKHRGICLELDVWQPDLCSAIKVQYRREYPIFLLDDAADLAPFYIKSSDWSYEEEYRLIAQEKSKAIAEGTLMTENGLYRLPVGTLKSIILGAQAPASTETEIMEMIRSSEKDVGLRRARCLPDQFQLQIVPPII